MASPAVWKTGARTPSLSFQQFFLVYFGVNRTAKSSSSCCTRPWSPQWLSECPMTKFLRGTTTKVEGAQGLGANTGALAGRVGIGAVVMWSADITSGKFVKTQMLNPAFGWLLSVKFLAFWKLRPRSWGRPIHGWSPNLNVWGPVSPGPYGCCAYNCNFQLCPSSQQILATPLLVSKADVHVFSFIKRSAILRPEIPCST